MRSYIEELGSLYNTRQYRLGCHLHLYCLFAGGWVVAWERLLVAPLSHLHRYILFAWSVEPSTLMDSLSLSLKFHQLDGPIWTYWLFFSLYCIFFHFLRKIGSKEKWKRVLPLHYPHKRHWLSSKWESALKSIANDFFLPERYKSCLILSTEYNQRNQVFLFCLFTRRYSLCTHTKPMVLM